MQNKAGAIVKPSVQSAQSAVRSRANILLFQSTCSGYGMCADVSDAEDYDVWPITAISVRHLSRPLDCGARIFAVTYIVAFFRIREDERHYFTTEIEG